ncbi:MAG: inosine/uridine-preferring nucleoside hydrolase [Segetibacter sp.]|nr:inosine/uridine-preferring nucleoside hydrolase [Segetibacter sp.]
MQAQTNKPVPVIFDTDMGPDYDDVGAITLLHAYADSGKANILATIASTKFEGVAAVLNILNTYFKKPGIPIGVPKGEAVTKKDWQHWTDTLIANYPHRIKTNDEVPDAVGLYRQILAKQPDRSVTIVTVGFFTNLSNLLKSGADKYSKLTGRQLVEKKVKQLVSMAGKFPAGKEFNVDQDPASSKYVFENWTTPIILSGFEIGQKIKTGLPLINNSAIRNSPVQHVFRISIPMAKEDSAGRMSWDETAVLVAIAGYKPFYTLQQGKIAIAADGSNTWTNSNNGNHFYLVEDRPVSEVQEMINQMMMHQPR